MIKKAYRGEAERKAITAAEESKGNRCRADRIISKGPPLCGELTFLEPSEIPEDDMAFARKMLRSTDADLARGLEDIIVLMDDIGMNITGRLPSALKDKLARRAELRALMSK